MTADATQVVTEALARITGHRAATCARGPALLEADLGVDSLALAELVETLQARLDIVVPDEVTARMRTVTDLQGAVISLVAADPTPPATPGTSS